MKISLFTPVHDLTYLGQAYASVKDQPFDEWVILRNGPAVFQPLGFEDPRVKILDLDADCTKIGSLKRLACMSATGDILVEFDADDLLVPGAIEQIRAAYQDPEIGFVYSNAAYFKDDFQKVPRFDPSNGWQYRPYTAPNGHELDEILSFEPTPVSIAKIWYAPDHVRTYRRDVYVKIGGHDKTFDACDDHDLMIRMYLATKFKKIDACLYLYRVHTNNTTWKSQERNTAIQTTTVALSHKAFHALCERWADLNGLRKIDLGGRLNKAPGYLSVDRRGADISADLTQRWPFDDNSIGIIRAFDIFEHLPDKLHTMNEVHRVLKPGGYLLSQTPSTDGRGAFQDPTHVSYWNEHSFWYYTKADLAKYIDNDRLRFQTVRLETMKPTEHLAWVLFDAVKIDEAVRHPGIVEI
jgi:SAM-dependent methyltransferase